MSAVWCRECREGKHPNCDGTAWDTDADKMILCQCPYAVHGSRPTQAPQVDVPTIPPYANGSPAQEAVRDRPRGDSANSPVLPYPSPEGPTSGFSGTDTSEARARQADADGTTADRQHDTAVLLDQRRSLGLTVKELRTATGWHHGQASSVLSVLHKEGVIARLAEVRDRCHVYVAVPYIDGRETQPHGRSRPKGPAMTDKEAWIDTVARQAIVNACGQGPLNGYSVEIEWENYPDIGRNDWEAILERVTHLLSGMAPAKETYNAALEALEKRIDNDGEVSP